MLSSPLDYSDYSAPLLRASDSVGLCSDGEQVWSKLHNCLVSLREALQKLCPLARHLQAELPQLLAQFAHLNHWQVCVSVSIYRGQGKAGSCQNFARETALSMQEVSCGLAKKGPASGCSSRGQRRGGKACTKLVQRISCLGVLLAREKGAGGRRLGAWG